MRLNIEQKKYMIIQEIVNTNDLKTIDEVATILKKRDFWLDLPEAAKASIRKGLEDLKNGRKKPHSEVMKKYKKWL